MILVVLQKVVKSSASEMAHFGQYTETCDLSNYQEIDDLGSVVTVSMKVISNWQILVMMKHVTSEIIKKIDDLGNTAL